MRTANFESQDGKQLGNSKSRRNRKIVEAAHATIERLEQRQLLSVSVTPTGGKIIGGVEGSSTGSVVVATFVDPSGAGPVANYSATIAWNDGTSSGGTISVASGVFTVKGTHTYAEEGTYNPSIVIHHVGAPDSSPVTDTTVISDPGVTVANGLKFSPVEGQSTGTITVATFTDPGGAEVIASYSASINWGDGTPIDTNATIVAQAGGVFAVQDSHTYAEESGSEHPGSQPYQITVTVSHFPAPDMTGTETATVSDPAVVPVAGAAVAGVEGASTAVVTLATFTDPAGNEAATDYSAAVNWGDGTASSAGTVTFDAVNNVFDVTGSHLYAQESDPATASSNPYTIKITIGHEGAPSAVVTNTATIADVAVVATGGFVITAVEGATTSSAQVATFTDPGGAEAVGNYSATIDWGDGSPTSSGTITVAGGVFTVKGSHSWAADGMFSPTVVVHHDLAPDSNIATDTANVSDPAVTAFGGLKFFAVEGQPFGGSGILATFTDPAGPEATGNYSATVDWGDGTASTPGNIMFVGGTVFAVVGTHSYAEESAAEHPGSQPYQITVTVHHGTAPDSNTVTDTATVSDPPVVAGIAPPITGVEASSMGLVTVATFTDPGGPEAAADYSAAINWGDGTAATAGTISYDAVNQVFDVTAAHTYAKASDPKIPSSNPYKISVTIKHEKTAQATASNTATITDAPAVVTIGPAINSVENSSTGTIVVATFTDPGPIDPLANYSATIDWGDGSPTDGGKITYSGGVFTVKDSHVYTEEGSYLPSVIIHIVGAPDSTPAVGTATVSNPAVVAKGGFKLSPVEGQATAALTLATFTDPAGAELPADYSASVNWGDGTPIDNGATIVAQAGGVFAVQESHTYAEESAADHLNSTPYMVTVTVLHDATVASNIVTDTAVVSDPAVVGAAGAAVTGVEGVSVGTVTVATFTDPGGNEAVGDYSASINWGDGTAATVGTITFDAVNNLFDVTDAAAPHTYIAASAPVVANSQPYKIVVTINHEKTPAVVVTNTATISDPTVIPSGGQIITSVEGASTGTVVLATFVDPGGIAPVADYTAAINWGDDSPIGLGTISGAGGLYTVKGSHIYAGEGVYTPSVIIHHELAPDPSPVTDMVTVTDASLSGNNGTQLTGIEGHILFGTLISFTDAGIGTPSDFSTVVSWGDGSTSAGNVVQDSSGHYHVTGAHLFAPTGTFNVSVTVTDVGGSQTTATNKVKIIDAPLDTAAGKTLTQKKNVPFTNLLLGTFRDLDPLSVASNYTGTISWGDGATSAATFLKSGSTSNVASYWHVTGSHKYTASKTYTVKITLHDVKGAAPITITTTIKIP